jgi:nicotinamide riboside kinase
MPAAKPFKIGIVGPESTGKSTLAGAISEHFNAPLVPEAARKYLQDKKGTYVEEDLLEIAQLQLAADPQSSGSAPSIIVYDTTLLVIKIWSEYKFGNCHPWILAQEQNEKYDALLLTDIDLPWEPDPLREHPDKRNELFNIYYRQLLRGKTPFRIISGRGQIRTQKALTWLEQQTGLR